MRFEVTVDESVCRAEETMYIIHLITVRAISKNYGHHYFHLPASYTSSRPT